MAKQDELELDDKAPKGGNKGMIIVIILVSVLLISGAVIGGLYFMGMLDGDESAQTDAPADTAQPDSAAPPKPAHYLDLSPAFVVNFADQSNAAYLQIEMQVMARDLLVLDEVKNHMPVIRNNILLVMSGQKFEEVRTRAGKERLQQQLLAAIQEVVADAMRARQQAQNKDGKAGSAPANVEQVYFTSFIMQ